MIYKVVIEGQELELEEDVAKDDATLKSALTPYFPGAANAKIMRSAPKEDVVTVTVIKQAGTKGMQDAEDQILRKLIDAREDMNPVVELDRNLEGKLLNQMSIEELVDLDGKIEQTIEAGRKEYWDIQSTLNLLINTEPKPSTNLVIGF